VSGNHLRFIWQFYAFRAFLLSVSLQMALRQASGSMFDVDAYIVDQRTEHS
jgi:hypothetical protein